MNSKKTVFQLLFFFFAVHSFSQTNFYALDTIQEIEIHFSLPNWDDVMDTAKAGAEGYTVADTVKINGVEFYQVGVKYKGSSSFDSTRVKNPLHLKLDYSINGANYFGVEDIKLSNGYSDPSMIREVLGYKILRNYMQASECNFARVTINGVYYGVYSSAQDLSNNFLVEHFYSSAGDFIKANPENVVSGQLPSLAYLGTDSTLYYSRYELKSDFGWEHLIQLCDTLSNETQNVDEVLDVDRAIWMLAFNNSVVNLDSYTGAFAQNYYLYRDHLGRFNPIVWDLNMCFGAFTNTGTANLNLSGMQTMSPILHSANPARPLIQKLLADTVYKKMYIAHLRTLNSENFLTGNYLSDANAFQSLIDSSVQAESFSLFSYPQFQTGLNGIAGIIPGIDTLMSARAAFLDTTPEFLLVPPLIASVNANPAVPAFGSTVTITSMVTNASSVYLGYRYKKSDRFTRIPMFDDGLHGDGSLGDEMYGVLIPVSSLDIQYYIYAENDDAGMFSPERAEFEFYALSPSIPLASPGDIVLNEFLAENNNGILNEEGNHRDWIELFNLTPNALGLNHLFLSDNFSNPTKWKFPADAFIDANGYLLVWADDKDAEWIDLHCNFNLASTGDSLILCDSNVNYYDSLTFNSPGADTAFARCPDGTGAFQVTVLGTPWSSNICTLVSSEPFIELLHSVSIFPNPADTEITIDAGNRIYKNVEIFNLRGIMVTSENFPENGVLDVSGLESGIYFLRFLENEGQNQSQKLAVFHP